MHNHHRPSPSLSSLYTLKSAATLATPEEELNANEAQSDTQRSLAPMEAVSLKFKPPGTKITGASSKSGEWVEDQMEGKVFERWVSKLRRCETERLIEKWGENLREPKSKVLFKSGVSQGQNLKKKYNTIEHIYNKHW